MAEDKTNEALDKLNRGIEESRQAVQQQTMELAQGYFADSTEALKQQIGESRATLEDLPRKIPGGEEEEGAFQLLFRELMENYTIIEEALDEARRSVANLDTERLMREGEIDASDAARREAEDLGVALTEVEGSGSGGRIIVSDVVEAAKETARSQAEEMGVNLEDVEGSGPGGLVVPRDLKDLEGSDDQGGEGPVDDLRQVTERLRQASQDAAGGAVQQADGAVKGVAAQNGSEGPKATNAARRKAEELGVDLSQLEGSGAGGLVTIKDVTKS